jgi:hypothetical protein
VGWYDPPERDVAFHNARFDAKMREIQRILNRNKKPIRGIPRPIYRDDGTWYESVSEAARHNRTRPDYICQAIRVGKTCVNRRWAYADSIPDEFWIEYIQNHPNERSEWPYSFSKCGIYPR